ncbi:uncharacterized protein LOC5516784 isoform X2 [Nematostella vectensis]|uniref:uncharacterized protein LOC5516784 isoform X2 n=1 Tax=Nematostella vectensis TaxID=45351 RepID=UPI00138FD6D3|nr:uncharacterized protein LOC5516784 isoform X2 [Nematostella vectensis]
MPSIACEGLRLVFALLISKLRDKGANALDHGDVTNEKFRDFIVRELKDIREKLDGLCKAELCAAANFFRDGVSLLYHYLSETQPCVVRLENETFKTHRKSTETSACDEWEIFHIMNDGFDILSIKPDDSTYKEAKLKFNQASRSATKAFSNGALKICDRILAMKFRVSATILEHLEKPEVAIVLCKNYLEQLNGLPEVEESFEVKFGGFHVKRWFCEMRRDTLITSVISLNRMLWEYMHYCEKGQDVLSDWPEVMIGSDRTVHPVFHDKVIRPYVWSFGEYDKTEDVFDGPSDVVTTSKGEFLVADRGNRAIKRFSSSGELIYSYVDLSLDITSSTDALVVKSSCLLSPQNVVTDAQDNIYFSKNYKTKHTNQFMNEIVALDAKGSFRWRVNNSGLGSRRSKLKGLAVDEGNACLVMLFSDVILAVSLQDGDALPELSINLCDQNSPLMLSQDSSICVSGRGEYLITGLSCIYVIDQTATHRKPIKPRSTNCSRKFYPCGIAVDQLSKEIIVADRASNSLMMFKKCGTFLRRINFMSHHRYLSGGITVMKNGHVAVADRNNNSVFVY